MGSHARGRGGSGIAGAARVRIGVCAQPFAPAGGTSCLQEQGLEGKQGVLVCASGGESYIGPMGLLDPLLAKGWRPKSSPLSFRIRGGQGQDTLAMRWEGRLSGQGFGGAGGVGPQPELISNLHRPRIVSVSPGAAGMPYPPLAGGAAGRRWLLNRQGAHWSGNESV